MRFLALLCAAAVPAAVITTPATATAMQAEDPSTWIGKKVVDMEDGEIGTVTGYKNGVLIVQTDKHEASLPPASFLHQNNKLYFGMKLADLNAAIEAAEAKQKAEMEAKAAAQQAAMEAALAPGAMVKGSAGAEVGTIEAIDEEIVTLKLVSGQTVRIPRNGIAATPEGAVVGATAEQLASAAEGGMN